MLLRGSGDSHIKVKRKLVGKLKLMWVKLKWPLRRPYYNRHHGIFCKTSLCTALCDTWMGKYSDFPSQTPQVRPKSAIYTPKRDNEHTRRVIIDLIWCIHLWLSLTGNSIKAKELHRNLNDGGMPAAVICLFKYTYIDFIVGSKM